MASAAAAAPEYQIYPDRYEVDPDNPGKVFVFIRDAPQWDIIVNIVNENDPASRCGGIVAPLSAQIAQMYSSPEIRYTMVLHANINPSLSIQAQINPPMLSFSSIAIYTSVGNMHEIVYACHDPGDSQSTPRTLITFINRSLLATNRDNIICLPVPTRASDIVPRRTYYFPNFVIVNSQPRFLKQTVSPLGYRYTKPCYIGYCSQHIAQFMASGFYLYDICSFDTRDIMQYYDAFMATPMELSGNFDYAGDNTVRINRDTVLPRNPPGDACHVSYPNEHPTGIKHFGFHTHPIHCHRHTGLVSGFPSVLDYTNSINQQRLQTHDGDCIFAREGVFILQLHPFLKYLIKYHDVGRSDMEDSIIEEYANQLTAYLERIGYNAARTGTTVDVRRLAAEIAHRNLTPAEIALIEREDPNAISQLFVKIVNYYVSITGMKFCPIFLQFIPRAYFIENKPCTFFVPRESLIALPQRGGKRRHHHHHHPPSSSSIMVSKNQKTLNSVLSLPFTPEEERTIRAKEAVEYMKNAGLYDAIKKETRRIFESKTPPVIDEFFFQKLTASKTRTGGTRRGRGRGRGHRGGKTRRRRHRR